jgi:polysaccharide chain length determinant protein (PEP-CTERM system associated)
VQAQLLGCWRFRWQAVGAAWLLALVGWATVVLMPDIYSASTRIYVDSQNALRPLLQGLAVDSDVKDEVRLMSRAILSRPNLEELARDTGLDIGAATPSEMDALIARLQASITVASTNEILEIAYQNADPAIALDVVSTLLESFVEGTLGANRTDTTNAEEFLQEKLTEYELRLNEAEARLAAFKRENVGMMPGEEGDYYSRLQQEMQRLESLEGQLRSTRQRRDELGRQLEGEEPVFGLVGGTGDALESSTVIDSEIAQYEEQLATLRLRFTDSHPDVIQVLSVLDGLRARREQLLAAQGGSSVSMPTMSGLDMNPVYQQMKMSFNQSEIDLRELESQRNSQTQRVNQLRQKVDTIPEIEAELSRLTRDYDVTRAQYDQLLRRLEQAKLSGAAEESKEDVKFRIIDPPSVSAEPVGPNRPVLTTGVLLLAVVGALAVSFLFNLMRPVFFSATQLERNFPYPVLGAVTLAPGSAAGIGIVNAAMLSLAFGVLLVVYAVLFVFSGSISGLLDAAGSVVGL